MARGESRKAAEPSIDELAGNTSTAVALMGLYHNYDSRNYLGYSCEGVQSKKNAGELRAEKADHMNAVPAGCAVGELAGTFVGHARVV